MIKGGAPDVDNSAQRAEQRLLQNVRWPCCSQQDAQGILARAAWTVAVPTIAESPGGTQINESIAWLNISLTPPLLPGFPAETPRPGQFVRCFLASSTISMPKGDIFILSMCTKGC